MYKVYFRYIRGKCIAFPRMLDPRFTINSRPLKRHMSNKETPKLNKDGIHGRSRHIRSTLLGRFTLSYLSPSVGGKKSFLISVAFPSQIDPLCVEPRLNLGFGSCYQILISVPSPLVELHWCLFWMMELKQMFSA